jgi:hypothetical protein
MRLAMDGDPVFFRRWARMLGRHGVRLAIAGCLATITVGAGCAASKRTSYSYPTPIFDTRPQSVPRRVATVRRPQPLPPPPPPIIQPPPATAYSEPGWEPGSSTRRWTDIVLHHSASKSGNARVFDDYHRNVRKWNELGYHFVIGNGSQSGDGQVEVGPRWHKQKHGAHCKTADNHYNDHGIGICLVGDFESRRPTPAQLASLDRLLRFLTQRFGISPAHIRGHRGVTGKTACPGRYFPLESVRRNLAQAQSWAGSGGGGDYRYSGL